MKDLGIIFDTQLTFHHQAATAATKANQVLAIIRKSFAFIDSITLTLLYKSLTPRICQHCMGPRFKIDQSLLE